MAKAQHSHPGNNSRRRRNNNNSNSKAIPRRSFPFLACMTICIAGGTRNFADLANASIAMSMAPSWELVLSPNRRRAHVD